MTQTNDDPVATIEALEPYEQVAAIAQYRESELRAMFVPIIEVTDVYGRLSARLVTLLGTVPPQNQHDVTLRDLLADAFDFLYEWRRPLLETRLNIAHPIGRRAYESLSLFAAIAQDASLGEKWEKGREIKNDEIRKALARTTMGESEEDLRALYKFFSQGAHPNRILIAERYLGQGNEFVLGPTGRPNLAPILDHFDKLVSCWFWFGAVSTFTWKELLLAHDEEYGRDYLAAARQANDVREWIRVNFNAVLAEEQGLTSPGTDAV